MNAQYFISIDCSHNIQVTLLASDFSVIENFESDSLPSQTLHKIIHELVSKNSIDISQIATFFLCLGPGSYTALRMIKGFKEICEYDGKLTCGFTYIDALKILGQDSYRFAEYAFKDEYFVFDNTLEPMLIKNFGLAASDYNINKVKKLILENSKIFYSEMIKNNQDQDILYFRSLKEEYKK